MMGQFQWDKKIMLADSDLIKTGSAETKDKTETSRAETGRDQ
jgi:hypothetical protein